MCHFVVKRNSSFAKVKNAIEKKRTAESDPKQLVYSYPQGIQPNQLKPYKACIKELNL